MMKRFSPSFYVSCINYSRSKYCHTQNTSLTNLFKLFFRHTDKNNLDGTIIEEAYGLKKLGKKAKSILSLFTFSYYALS